MIDYTESIKEYILVFSTIITILIIIRCFTPIFCPPNPSFYIPNDHTLYIKMAQNPFIIFNGAIIAPFCYRILGPLIAWFLPFDLLMNFQIIMYISLILTGLILYDIFKHFFNKILAFTGLFLFYSLEWAVRFSMYNIWRIDCLAFLFIILCFWAINKSNLKIYGLSLFLGVLTKEIVLFTIPVLIISEFLKKNELSSFKNEDFFKYIITILPSIIIFILLRIIIVPDPNWEYNYIYLLENVGYKRRFKSILKFDMIFIYFCTIATWGLILCIAPFFNSKSNIKDWIKRYGIFILLVYSQLLIATDIERLLVAGFYPIILLTLSGMKNLSQKKNINEISYLVITIIIFILQLILSKNIF